MIVSAITACGRVSSRLRPKSIGPSCRPARPPRSARHDRLSASHRARLPDVRLRRRLLPGLLGRMASRVGTDLGHLSASSIRPNGEYLARRRGAAMRYLIGLCSLVLLGGCVSFNADMVRELAKDPATAAVTIQTPYGYLRWVRSNPTAGTSVTIDPAGVFTIRRD